MVAELMDACRNYFDKTGRRITFEYALVKGENDTEEDAAALSRLLKSQNCHVNLIPVNPVTETAAIAMAVLSVSGGTDGENGEV